MQRNSTQRWTTITFPDQTKSVQYSYNAPGLYNDGYIFRDETRDANDAVLRYSTVTWEQGDYGSARPVRIEAFDERNQMTKAEFVYGGPYNQVTTVRDYDYGGVALLRTTGVLYRNNTEYTGRHIFNLVRRVDVWNASLDTLMSRVEYNHDEPADSTLVNTLSVVQHNEAYNPYIPPDCRLEDDPDDPDCWGGCLENVASQGCDGICHQIEVCTGGYVPATHYRGNVTSVTRYAAAANAPEEPSPPGAPNIGGAITEIRTYDITGNMVTASTSCCEQMSFVYTLATQFAHPDSQTRGSADTASAARITTSADYNFNTSLTISAKDANQLQSQISYFAANLRPQTLTLPTLGSTTYAYDDVAMSVTETANASGGAVASQNVKLLNGLGQVKLESALGNNSIVDFVATQYDQMGRVKIQTRPYRTGQDPQPTETFYDALGRAERIVAPDGSESRSYFNETTRPSTASSLPGQTTRVVDAWGRERWARLDADGRLVEVVEPDPLGNGSVLSTGTLVTTYSYDTLGNLTQVNQGSQQRKFRYDSLSRLTHQKLAEESPTLNDLGQYVGSGTWSETFTYDERSNLITQTDARGVKTNYSYNGDPLNRLLSVSYDIDPAGDTIAHQILPAPGVTYDYMPSGDKTRLFKVTTANVSTDEYGYDSEGRVNLRTLTMTSRPNHPMVTEYIYDTLNRVTDVRYPAQYEAPGNPPRKLVHHDYDVSSRLTGLKVGSADYASQITYNAASQTTSLKAGTSDNSVTESYAYDDLTGLLTNQKVQRGVVPLMDLSYDYLRPNTTEGRTGQLTKILNNLNHNRDRGFEYDKLGRLTRATGGASSGWAQDYVYDRYGNRTSVTASGDTASLTRPKDGSPNDQLIAFNTAPATPRSLRANPTGIVSDAMDGLRLSAPVTSKSTESPGVNQGRAVFDVDLDGKTDFASYRGTAQGLWSIRKSSDTNSGQFFSWGVDANSTLAYGDFDGDGKIDLPTSSLKREDRARRMRS